MMEQSIENGESRSLTVKQEAFVRAYLESGNASQAYRAAYDAGNMKDSAIRANACKLLKHTDIALTIERARKSAQQSTNITIERLTRLLQAVYCKAMAEPKGASAAASAVMGIAKLHGLIVDRSRNEHTGPDGHPLVPILNVTVGRQHSCQRTS